MTNHNTEEKLRKLAALDPRFADKNWLFYLAGTGEERDEADDLLDVLLFQNAKKDFREQIFLEPPPVEDCVGEYVLGDVLYPPGTVHGSFGLREKEWNSHVLITGMSGAGKTNLAFQILRELRKKQKPFLVFDWKRNYRDLLQLPEFQNTKIFTVGRDVSPFRFNPLIPPPGIPPGQWLMKLVDVIKHAYFVGDGVEYLLREAIDQVYEDCGYIIGTNHKVPTFHLVQEQVQKRRLKGRMALWKASAMRVLESLCFRHGLEPVVNTDGQWDYEKLLNSDVVLELDTLSDSDKLFLVETMILWIYEFKKNSGKREHFSNALIIEEAHHVLSQMKENAEGAETIMETCLRQIRELGVAVIAIDQEPSKLSNSIKANTYSKITFNLGNGKDILDMSLCMALTNEETDFLDWLDIGHAIVALKGRVHVPLHVSFPHISLDKGLVTDDDLRKKM